MRNYEPSPQKSYEDSPGERDMVMSALRVAATRSRLQTNIFKSIYLGLRQKQLSCAEVIQRLKDEGLFQHIKLPGGVR